MLGGEVEIDAVHHGAQLVLCCGEERTVDILGQKRGGDSDSGGLGTYLLGLGELVGILHGEREMTILVVDLRQIGCLVNLEGDGLLGQALHGLKQVVVANAETAVAVGLVQLHRGLHHHFAVGRGEVQTSVNDFKQEVAQDRQRILTVDYS